MNPEKNDDDMSVVSEGFLSDEMIEFELSDAGLLDEELDEAFKREGDFNAFMRSGLEAEEAEEANEEEEDSLDLNETQKAWKLIAQITFACVGIERLFSNVMVKFGNIYALVSDCTFLSGFFAQAISIGFEKKASELMQKANKNGPHNLVIYEKGNFLGKVYSSVTDAILESPNVKAKIISDFNDAYNKKMSAFKTAEKRLVTKAFTGGDFTYNVTKNSLAIARRMRAFRDGRYGKSESMFGSVGEEVDFLATGLYEVSDHGVVGVSAIASTMFIQVDTIGRYIGEELAKLTVCFCAVLPKLGSISLGLKSMNMVVALSKFVMGVLYLNREVMKFVDEWGKTLLFGTYKGIFHPAFSGVMAAFYEELSELQPEVFPKLMEEQEKEANANVQLEEPKNKDDAAISFIKDTFGMFVECVVNARAKKYEEYDKVYEKAKEGSRYTAESQRRCRALIVGCGAAEGFLEGRRALLSVFKPLDGGNKNVNAFKEKVKPFILTVRAAPLAITAFISGMTFKTTKFFSGLGIKVGYVLGKSLKDFLSSTEGAKGSKLSDRSIEVPVEEETDELKMKENIRFEK